MLYFLNEEGLVEVSDAGVVLVESALYVLADEIFEEGPCSCSWGDQEALDGELKGLLLGVEQQELVAGGESHHSKLFHDKEYIHQSFGNRTLVMTLE